jgi:hypothetical protein
VIFDPLESAVLPSGTSGDFKTVEGETKQMLGWILIFALMALFGAFFTAADPGSGLDSIKFATIVFSALFFAAILTRIARRRV